MSECDHAALIAANKELATSVGRMAEAQQKTAERIQQGLGGAIILGFICGALIGGILAVAVVA